MQLDRKSSAYILSLVGVYLGAPFSLPTYFRYKEDLQPQPSFYCGHKLHKARHFDMHQLIHNLDPAFTDKHVCVSSD